MNSLDTNILYYATNTACPEHEKALTLLERVANEPVQWIIADQVLFEYYRLVRNPVVLANLFLLLKPQKDSASFEMSWDADTVHMTEVLGGGDRRVVGTLIPRSTSFRPGTCGDASQERRGRILHP